MHTNSNKCPTEFEPSRHRSKPSPVIRPLARSRVLLVAPLCQSLPNSAQKPRRGRRVSVPRPFNGDFDGTNLVEFTHRIPRRRYDREAVPICGTRARIAGRSASGPVPTDRVAHPASSDDAARAHARRDRSHPFPSRAIARIDRHPRFPASIPRLTGPAPPAFSQA